MITCVRGRNFAGYVAVIASLLSCKSAAREKHEAFGPSLKLPASHLCRTWNKEGGGCNGDCITFLTAERARHSLLAAQAFSKIPAFDDPQTETLLENVRAASRDLEVFLGTPCEEKVDRAKGMSESVKRCADAFENVGTRVGRLRDAYGALTTSVEKRTAAKLPNHETICAH